MYLKCKHGRIRYLTKAVSLSHSLAWPSCSNLPGLTNSKIQKTEDGAQVKVKSSSKLHSVAIIVKSVKRR